MHTLLRSLWWLQSSSEEIVGECVTATRHFLYCLGDRPKTQGVAVKISPTTHLGVGSDYPCVKTCSLLLCKHNLLLLQLPQILLIQSPLAHLGSQGRSRGLQSVTPHIIWQPGKFHHIQVWKIPINDGIAIIKQQTLCTPACYYKSRKSISKLFKQRDILWVPERQCASTDVHLVLVLMPGDWQYWCQVPSWSSSVVERNLVCRMYHAQFSDV